ncbi:hypothetical protein DFAR_1040006 [Desulfarculales bacterium]
MGVIPMRLVVYQGKWQLIPLHLRVRDVMTAQQRSVGPEESP